MATSLVDAESVLTVDLGSVNTRIALFDVVDGRYSYIAGATTPTSVNAPVRDIGEGVRSGLERLQEITGRNFLDHEHKPIIPSAPDGSGADSLVVTFSCGPELRVAIAGLLPEVSLASAQNLVSTMVGRVVESIGLNDRRRTEAQVDAIIQARPDLVILAGGADQGASRSVARMVELMMLVCRVTPPQQRPEIVYAGNQVLAKKVTEGLSRWTRVTAAPNIRPSIDNEDLGPAQEVMNQTVAALRMQQIGGLEALGAVSSVPATPTAAAFGRLMRFLSLIYDPNRGVLGVDLGAEHTIAAAAVAGDLTLQVTPAGLGKTLPRLLDSISPEEVSRWLPMLVTPDAVRDYFYQKSLYPGLLPASAESLAIEQAAARLLMRQSLAELTARGSFSAAGFEPILASGAVLAQAATPGQALLMLLDGLQPSGVTTFILDRHGLIPGLGAVAQNNAALPVQVLESGAFLNLGTVISPISPARYGSLILKIRMQTESGSETRYEVRQGMLNVLPVQPGQVVTVQLEPLRGTLIDLRGRKGAQGFKITGGLCGLVIDARGRPLILPKDDARRRDQIKKWAQAFQSV